MSPSEEFFLSRREFNELIDIVTELAKAVKRVQNDQLLLMQKLGVLPPDCSNYSKPAPPPR